jgi:hypothetical protein
MLLALLALVGSLWPSIAAPASAAATVTVAAAADAHVNEAAPGTNYGTAGTLEVDGDPGIAMESYLRFTVTGLSGAVQRATLRLYAVNGSTNGPAVYATSNSWSETAITWSTRPARIGGTTDDKGTVAKDAWVDFDVTPLVAGDGTYSFVLVPTSTDGADFSSRQASGNRPQLVLTTEDGGTTTPPPPPSTAPSTDCSSYPQSRQFVDAQAWWTQTPGKGGDDFGHLHVGACIPERETLTGTVPLNVRVIFHDNPGTFVYLSLVLKGTDYETTVSKHYLPDFTCPVGTCERWLAVPVDTSKFGHSGLQEIRLRAFVDEPDGNRMHASLNWQAYIDNGKSRADVSRQPYLRGKGWYSGSGYCEADFVSVPLPDAPVSGVWAPSLRIVDHGTSEDLPVTRHSVRLDPDFHNGVPGTVLREGSGPWSGTVSIDTTRLPNGQHKLFLRAECDDPRGSTNAGVLIVTFVVKN